MRQFSQSQIQNYLTCNYRFYLAHILKISWLRPLTPQSKQQELDRQRGNAFHMFVNRIVQGMDPSIAQKAEKDPLVQKWIHQWISTQPLKTYETLYSEITLSKQIDHACWLGKFDIIALKKDHLHIFDWKTTAKPLSKEKMEKSIQTRLYQFLLSLNQKTFGNEASEHPEQITMSYWNPNYPDQQIQFPYSGEKFLKDRAYFAELYPQLCKNRAEDFPQTPHLQNCQTCQYQTRCNRVGSNQEVIELEEYEGVFFADWEEQNAQSD